MNADFVWVLLFAIFLLGVVYLMVVKPFIEGMRAGKRNIDRRKYQYPEQCPMCGAETLMTRELRCAHCGEDLGPPEA